MSAPRWWDEGRASYEPHNPFLNTNMIWIAGLVVPFVLVLLPALLVAAINAFCR